MKIEKYLNEGNNKIKTANFLFKLNDFHNDLLIFSGAMPFDAWENKEVLKRLSDLNKALGDFKTDLIKMKTRL